MTTTTKTNMSENVDANITDDYKIYMIINNTSNEYYISQTTSKYLSVVLSDMKRRKSKLTEHLFTTGDYEIVLLEVMRTNNLHFVKNKVNELIKAKKAEKEAISIKTLDGRGKAIKAECGKCEEDSEEDTEEEEEEEEDSEEDTEEEEEEEEDKLNKKTTATQKTAPKYKCVCCDKMEYVKNKTRHEKTNKHIKNSKK